MSKKEVLMTQEETEVMQATGVPAQEIDGVSVVMATEIIADLKKQLEDAKEEADNLEKDWEFCSQQRLILTMQTDIINFALKIFDYKCLSMALSYVKAAYNQQPPEEDEQEGGRVMKKCTLTQVPCREAITEVVKANKNKKSLQLTYEVAELFRIVMTDENSTLSKEDWKRYFIITKLFMISDLRHLECIDSFTNGLMGS